MKFDNGIYKWLFFRLQHLFITLYQTVFLSRFFLQCQSERDFLCTDSNSRHYIIQISQELYFENGKLILQFYLALPFGFALGLPKFSTLDPELLL
jgi:phosphatidate cytidylyltransferase